MSDAQRPNSSEPNPATSGAEGEAVVSPDLDAATDKNVEEAEPDFETDVDGNPVPSPEVLAEQALPAIYSRSPRLVQVVATVAFIGAGVGLLIGLVLPAGFATSRLAAGVLTALAGALLGGLIAGIVVANNEAREARSVAYRKNAAIDDWLAAHPDYPAADSSAQPSKDSSP